MFTHIMVGTNDIERARGFYDAALGALGLKNLLPPEAPRLAYRSDTGAFVVGKPANGEPATFGNGAMVSFVAPDQAAVEAFHAGGLAAGGTCEGAPGTRTGGGSPMYGAYLRDPEGNKISAFARPK